MWREVGRGGEVAVEQAVDDHEGVLDVGQRGDLERCARRAHDEESVMFDPVACEDRASVLCDAGLAPSHLAVRAREMHGAEVEVPERRGPQVRRAGVTERHLGLRPSVRGAAQERVPAPLVERGPDVAQGVGAPPHPRQRRGPDEARDGAVVVPEFHELASEHDAVELADRLNGGGHGGSITGSAARPAGGGRQAVDNSDQVRAVDNCGARRPPGLVGPIQHLSAEISPTSAGIPGRPGIPAPLGSRNSLPVGQVGDGARTTRDR